MGASHAHRSFFDDDGPLAEPNRGRAKPSIDAAFAAFDHANPHVYELFKRFAAQAKNAGLTRYSADAILHRVRWHSTVETTGDGSGFKINNNFASRYSRKLVAEHPEYDGFFETRICKTQKEHAHAAT